MGEGLTGVTALAGEKRGVEGVNAPTPPSKGSDAGSGCGRLRLGVMHSVLGTGTGLHLPN
jgi:hypothetical protein